MIVVDVIARPKAEAIQKATGKKLDCFVVPAGLLAMTGVKAGPGMTVVGAT